MPLLGDFLGHIMAEITIARMHADLEALRVADFYASHPLLHNMPVPRFRLSDFDVDLPIMIDKVEEAPSDDLSPRGGVEKDKIFTAFNIALSRQLSRYRIRTPLELRNQIRFALRRQIKNLTDLPDISVDASRIASELTKTVIATFKRYYSRRTPTVTTKEIHDKEKVTEPGPSNDVLVKFSADLQEDARKEIIKVRVPPPRLHILVTTREIKEAGIPDYTGRLKIKVHEDSLEWALIEREDETQARLIPE
jgi:hypothetical protein